MFHSMASWTCCWRSFRGVSLRDGGLFPGTEILSLGSIFILPFVEFSPVRTPRCLGVGGFRSSRLGPEFFLCLVLGLQHGNGNGDGHDDEGGPHPERQLVAVRQRGGGGLPLIDQVLAARRREG